MTKKLALYVIAFSMLVPSLVFAQHARSVVHQYTSETANEMARSNIQKGADRFGKIADELLDKVYMLGWRQGHFRFKPGAQASSYQLMVRVFFDKTKLDMEQASETQFNPMGPSKDGRTLIGTIPAAKLLLLNSVPGVLAVEDTSITTLQIAPDPAPYVIKRQNPAALERAGVRRAWTRWGKGKGVKVGIIDGGFINLNALLDAGILPRERVHLRQVLPDELAKQRPLGVGHHGSAVTEVIHELAPEAELYLYPTALMAPAWEKAVRMAVEDGVHVINSSLNVSYGALDGLGTPNTYLDPAIEAGILYVNSAGNNGASTYNAPFTDYDRSGWHDFSVGDEGNSVYLNKGEMFSATLTWDDYGANPETPDADQDLDLYLFYTDPQTHKSTQISQSQNIQAAESDTPYAPIESISFPQGGAPHTGLYSLMIRAHRINANRTIHMRLIMEAFAPDQPPPNIYKPLQYASRQMSMTKPADHPGVVTAAACGIDGNVHTYSGTGPSASDAKKPDITGYSGLETSSMQAPFFGTSCAAPFVAGCAALVWQKYPDAEEAKKQLLQRAIDHGPSGHDFSTGWGIVCLDDADPLHPSAELVTISRVQEVQASGIPGFNVVVVLICEKAKKDKIFTSLCFLKLDGSPIKAGEGMGVYTGDNGELRVTRHLIPSTSEKVAFESWLFVPDSLVQFAGSDAVAEIQLETESGKSLAKKRLGSVTKLLVSSSG